MSNTNRGVKSLKRVDSWSIATMNIYLAWALTISWYIVWPVWLAVYYLAGALLVVLKLLYQPIAFILQPVVYFGKIVATCLAFPFRLLAKLEVPSAHPQYEPAYANKCQPLYNYLGVAALVGIAGGLAIAYTYITLQRLLKLDAASDAKPDNIRTAKQYREDKAAQRAKLEQPLLSPIPSDGFSNANGRSRGRNLLAQTIMEEVDSDY